VIAAEGITATTIGKLKKVGAEVIDPGRKKRLALPGALAQAKTIAEERSIAYINHANDAHTLGGYAAIGQEIAANLLPAKEELEQFKDLNDLTRWRVFAPGSQYGGALRLGISWVLDAATGLKVPVDSVRMRMPSVSPQDVGTGSLIQAIDPRPPRPRVPHDPYIEEAQELLRDAFGLHRVSQVGAATTAAALEYAGRHPVGRQSENSPVLVAVMGQR